MAKALDTRDASDVARDLGAGRQLRLAVRRARRGHGGGGGPVEPRRTPDRWWCARRPPVRFLVEPPPATGAGPGSLPSARTWPMPRRAPGTQRATTTDGRTASPAGCRRAGHGCSTSRSSRSSTRAGSRSATVRAACASTRRPRSCPCRGRATTARPAPPAIARRGAGGPGVRHADRGAPPPEHPAVGSAGRYRRGRSTSASGRLTGRMTAGDDQPRPLPGEMAG